MQPQNSGSRTPGSQTPGSQSSSSQSSSSQSSSSQTTGQNAPGTAPIKNPGSAAALAPGKGPSYENRWDIYGGLAFANGQAGQNLVKRYNMGGGEGQFTYWLSPKLGIAGDYRWGGGTTPVVANPTYNRVLVMQNIFAGGVQYRRPKNRYVAINYHAFAGGDSGDFDYWSAIIRWGRAPVDVPGIWARQPRTVLQPHRSVGGGGRQHRFQPGTEAGGAAVAGPDDRALRHGDTLLRRRLAGRGVSRRAALKAGNGMG